MVDALPWADDEPELEAILGDDPLAAYGTVLVHFATADDLRAFDALTDGASLARDPVKYAAAASATLFGEDDEFRADWAAWRGMPEFVNDDLTPFASVVVRFRGPDDRRAFEALVGQSVNRQTSRRQPYVWYPKATRLLKGDKRYRSLAEGHP